MYKKKRKQCSKILFILCHSRTKEKFPYTIFTKRNLRVFVCNIIEERENIKEKNFVLFIFQQSFATAFIHLKLSLSNDQSTPCTSSEW